MGATGLKRMRGRVVAATLAIVVTPLFIPRARLGPAVLLGLRPGMTAKEVQAVVGAPPGDYDGITTEYGGGDCMFAHQNCDVWFGLRGNLTVWYDDQGRAVRFTRGEDVGLLVRIRDGAWSPREFAAERWCRLDGDAVARLLGD